MSELTIAERQQVIDDEKAAAARAAKPTTGGAKTVSLSLSQRAIDELVAFVRMPRIVAASLTGPTKDELLSVLASHASPEPAVVKQKAAPKYEPAPPPRQYEVRP